MAVSSVNARKCAEKQPISDALFVCCAWVFVDLGKFMGQKPSISYRQSTGYQSYMSHNNNALCRPCLTLKQFYWSKTACDPIEYTLKGADYWTCMPDFRSVTAAGGSTRHVLKIARRLKAIVWLCLSVRRHQQTGPCFLYKWFHVDTYPTD